MELTILGSSSMVPTKERNVSSVHLEYRGEGILFDCGEGTQRQMNIAGINRNKVKKILITHWHGDHVSGIIGLIQTMGNSDNPGGLKIIGPKETKKRMGHMRESCIFDSRTDVVVEEVRTDEKIVVEECEDYLIEAAPLEHSAPTVGYSFKEKDKLKIDLEKAKEFGLKEGPRLGRLQNGETITFKGEKIRPEDVTTTKEGRKVSYITDTRPCLGAKQLAEDSDLIITDSTYLEELKERAVEHSHMTAEEAATIASTSNAKKLILTHFSKRYTRVDKLVEEARKVFPNTEAAHDFKKIKL